MNRGQWTDPNAIRVETDPAKLAQLQNEAENWKEGGAYRTALHAAAGALGGGLAGAAGATTSALAMPAIAGQIDKMDAPEAVKQALAQVTAGALGVAVGGTAGLASAVNVEANNRQLHQTEKDWIKSNAARYATQKGISAAQAQQELTAQADRQVQSGSPGEWDHSASAFLGQAKGMLAADGNSGPGYMFYATPYQKANPNMYAGYGGSNNPSASDLAAAINRDQTIRQNASNATLAAAGAASAIAGAGPLAAISGTPIFSANGALGSGMWASPLGTGAISAGINAGTQYYQNGAINPVDLAMAAASGGAGAYGGLLWNMGVNAAGGATGTAINNYLYGQNNSIGFGAIASGIAGGFGYGTGNLVNTGFNNLLRPTINNPNWVGTSGFNLFLENRWPVIGASIGGSVGGETAGATINNIKTQIEKKK